MCTVDVFTTIGMQLQKKPVDRRVQTLHELEAEISTLEKRLDVQQAEYDKKKALIQQHFLQGNEAGARTQTVLLKGKKEDIESTQKQLLMLRAETKTLKQGLQAVKTRGLLEKVAEAKMELADELDEHTIGDMRFNSRAANRDLEKGLAKFDLTDREKASEQGAVDDLFEELRAQAFTQTQTHSPAQTTNGVRNNTNTVNNTAYASRATGSGSGSGVSREVAQYLDFL
jgi:hypothetical protein